MIGRAMRVILVAGALAAWVPAGSAEPPAAQQPDNTRGQALYETHCQGCHRAQVHWRDRKSVQDWAGLRAQVRHWETQARLQWRDEDIEAVCAYLNSVYYRFALPG